MGVDRVKVHDFMDADGKVDWEAFDEAKLDNGQRCEECGAMILWPCGHRTTCAECKRLRADGEVAYRCRVRCPKCGVGWNPYEREQQDLFDEGAHTACCPDCEHEFTVETLVTRIYTSPARLKEEEAAEAGG